PGEAHTSEGTSEAAVALEAPGDAGDLPGDTDARHASGSEQRETAPRREGGRRYSPVVMRMAAEHDLALSQSEGTGRGGRVRKQDVLAFLEAKPEPPMHIESPYKPDEAPPRVPGAAGAGSLSRMRQTIGRAMVESLATAGT